jgi:hypothetical protein
MSDLTKHTASTCAQNLGFEREVPGSKPGVTYRVTYARLFGIRAAAVGCEYGWECTCENFHHVHYHRGTDCKHIASMKNQKCTWNSACDPGIVVDDGKCPECGGPLEYVQVAV